jgi:hypothetical protein
MFRSSDDHHQGAFWSWLKSGEACRHASPHKTNERMLPHNHTWRLKSYPVILTGSKSSLMMIIWWSKHVGVILSVLVCDIWISVSLQTSALVGPLYIVASNVCGSSVWNFLHITLLAHWVLRMHLVFWKSCATLFYTPISNIFHSFLYFQLCHDRTWYKVMSDTRGISTARVERYVRVGRRFGAFSHPVYS